MYSVQQKKNQRLFLRENTSPCQLFFDSSLFQGQMIFIKAFKCSKLSVNSKCYDFSDF